MPPAPLRTGENRPQFPPIAAISESLACLGSGRHGGAFMLPYICLNRYCSIVSATGVAVSLLPRNGEYTRTFMPQQEIIPGHIDALIQAIYRGPLEAQLWQSFLNLIREAVGGNYATLLLRPPRAGDQGVVLNALLASHAVYSAYNDTYFALDPFVDLPSGEVATLQEYVPSQQMLDSDYYLHYLKPIDVFHIMGADLRDSDGMLTRLRITLEK